MTTKTSPVVVSDTFTALRLKSFHFSYNSVVQKA